MKIILYTIGCDKCDILKEKLESKDIEFTIFDNEEDLKSMGFDKFPVLEVDGTRMDYGDAVKWVNAQKGE